MEVGVVTAPKQNVCWIEGMHEHMQISKCNLHVEPLQSLMDQYRAAMGLTLKEKLSFFFEGQKLKGKNTAVELGLESDDIIEVWS
ncbi:hypothetical protein GDO86_018158 [Hymenochirus boettgeri]|uniref:NFATC2-interacting protein n=1 Tax=Hymenochirus boettgeri TaxID=247094 RepID=A0A8T2IEX0_9PIPI|nr:hypothetical protein GDO86_018158 [Hymenochirus boettgeri]